MYFFRRYGFLFEVSHRISRRHVVKRRNNLRSFLMLKFYVKASETLRQLRSDKNGVVSFEYVIVAAAIVGAVTLAYGAAGGAGPIKNALDGAIAGIVAKLPVAPAP